MSVTIKPERPKMELAKRGPVAHICNRSDPTLSICGIRAKSAQHEHADWDGKTYCVVCIEINGGPPNWWSVE